jgi:integrase/recombinase XerD
MPPPAGRHPDPFSMVGKPLPTSLQAGVDTSVIALWLGHERADTTQIYLHADLELKEKALALTAPANTKPGRYKPPGQLLAFLESL